MEQADFEFVAGADAPAVVDCEAILVEAGAGAVVVGQGAHGVDAQGGVFASLDVDVGHRTAVLVAAQGQVNLGFVEQTGLLVHLVDRATGGATAEEHGSGAPQHFDAIHVEGVAVVEGRVAHAVDEQVAGGVEGEAAQADVFLAAFGRQEGDARGHLEGFLDGVDLAVVHELLGDDGDGLGNVAEFLLAFADAGGGGAQGVLAFLLAFGVGLDDHRLEGLLVALGGGGLGEGAHGSGEHHGAERKDDFLGRRRGNGSGGSVTVRDAAGFLVSHGKASRNEIVGVSRPEAGWLG